METGEEKAKEYADKFNIYLGGMKVYPPIRDAFIAGYNKALRWRDPKEELPSAGEEVQLKIFDTYHNKQEYTHDVYLGGRWRLCESKYIDILGWRPIE